MERKALEGREESKTTLRPTKANPSVITSETIASERIHKSEEMFLIEREGKDPKAKPIFLSLFDKKITD